MKVTDPQKFMTAAAAYRDFKACKRADLPDVRDVLLDQCLPDMGFAAKAGLDGAGLLVQLCRQCHNGDLDQTISRAKFDTRLKMPPALFHTMTDAEASLMVQELKK